MFIRRHVRCLFIVLRNMTLNYYIPYKSSHELLYKLVYSVIGCSNTTCTTQ